jgi:large subunit ribosomal protein L25
LAETITFAAERRESAGTGPARALRRAGKIPAIVYGGHEKPLQVALTFKEVRRQVTTNARFFSSVVELDLDGEKVRVLPREAQLHPVTDDPLHVDFMRAEAGALVTVGVPVRFVNEQQAPGLKRGGVLNIVRREVELLCPADRIPAEIVADLSGLDINDSLHISAVQLPEGVRPTITDRDFTIASIKPPSTEVEEPTPGTETDKGED